MPRVLNVEKLQKKFASLTRSRESIQSLSAWIMHHSEFHEDIVNQWLIGLSKDYNALVMFYVANDVIQNCGKKRVPEFREDFSKVLERALSLEKVKEITREVTRLLTFWKERDIYDEEFSQKLQNILVSKEVKVQSESEEEEASELEIIARFKQENLVNNLKTLKSAASERIEKEEILNYAEEPEMPELEDMIGRKDCHDMVKKCDIYLKLVGESIDLSVREINQRKLVLKDLKDCCVFYTAQSRDVKEVANMFRIYGKKLKIMEKKAAERKMTLPAPGFTNSPCFSDTSAPSPATSFSSYVSPADREDSTNVLKSTQGAVQSSSYSQSLNPVQEAESTEGKKSFFELLSKEKSAGELDKNLTTQPSDQSELAKHEDGSSQIVLSEQVKCDSDNKADSFLADPSPEVSRNQNEDILDSLTNAPTQPTIKQTVESNNDSENQQPKNLVVPQSSSISDQCTKRTVTQQENASNQQINTSNQAAKDNDVPIEDTPDQSNKSISSKKTNTAREGDANDIDFLLEESYDCKREKAKSGIKRKIEALLNLKGKKQCTNASSEKPNASSEVSDLKSTEKSASSVKPNASSEVSDLKPTEKSEHINDSEKPCKVEEMGASEEDTCNKRDGNAKRACKLSKTEMLSNISAMEDVVELKNFDETEDQHLEAPVEQHMAEEKDANESSCKDIFSPVVVSQEAPSDISTLFNPNATFTGTDLNSYLSNISTELLKNILEKNKSKLSVTSQDCNENKTSENASNESTLDSSILKDACDDSQTPSQILDSKPITLDGDPIQSSETSVSENNPLLTDSKYNPELNLGSCEKAVIGQKESNSSEDKSVENIFIPCLDSFPGDSDQKTLIKDAESPTLSPPHKQIEELLPPHEDNKEIQTETVKPISSEQITGEEKPNFLQTLQSVLECISKKHLPNPDASFDAAERLGPPMPFENCLRIYSALCYSKESFGENASKLPPSGSYTLTNDSMSKGKEDKASNISLQDNFEVMDMECDTDEENC